MSTKSSFMKLLLSSLDREDLCLKCPSTMSLLYQFLCASLATDGKLVDPAPVTAREDSITDLLKIETIKELIDAIFSAKEDQSFLYSLQSCLHLLWEESSSNPFYLHQADEALRFFPPPNSLRAKRLPLQDDLFLKVCTESGEVMRRVVSLCLSGVKGSPSKDTALTEVLQHASLLPEERQNTGDRKRRRSDVEEPEPDDEGISVSPHAIQFCMMSLQQQWWTLVKASLECAIRKGEHHSPPVPRSLLVQLLSVLAALDSSSWAHYYPTATEDYAAHLLLGYLSCIGLVEKTTSGGGSYFAVSPLFHHAVLGTASAPLCLTNALSSDGASDCLQREDIDTIVTETNFRLYVYTNHNKELLSIVSQFSEEEESIDNILVCFRITRESFGRALRRGIEASQVIKFLTLKAHPSMIQKYGKETTTGGVAGGALPQSVCDQLLVWEKEFNRITLVKDVVLLRNVSPECAERVVQFLSDRGEEGAVLHSGDGYMVLREKAYQLVTQPKGA